MRGGHGAPSIIGIASCSGVYWLLLALAFAFAVVVTAFFARKNLKLWDLKAELNYRFSEGDVHWTTRNTIVHPCMCFLAGVAAGLLGIGGGLVLGPLFLEMGMLPGVSAATAAFMILFTSSATTLQFVLLGMLRLDYSLWYGAVGMCGTIVGQKLAGYFIKKYKRQSLIIFLLGGVIALSAAVMGAVGAAEVWADYQAADWEAFQFSPLCE